MTNRINFFIVKVVGIRLRKSIDQCLNVVRVKLELNEKYLIFYCC
jgi:hypothetical protein